MQNYPNDIRFVFKNMPLNLNSEALAYSAYCAGEQGKFWQFHDRLYSGNAEPDAVASELGLNIPEFKTCQSSEGVRAFVRSEANEAASLGITGTPSFIINDRLVHGVLSYKEFAAILEEELRRLP